MANSSNDVCKVYDRNDFFTVAVQLFLALAALSSLYIKRMQEVPRRTFTTWVLDVSKQGIGAVYAHILNMIVAAAISQKTTNNNSDSSSESTTTLSDQCAWYGISYMIDTSLGLLLAIVLLGCLDRAAARYHWTYLKDSGVYTGDTALLHWSAQLMSWLLILTFTKLLIYCFMWACSEPLAVIGAWLFAPLQVNIRLELVFVMILVPAVLNVIYFWIADSFLKAKKEHVVAHEPETIQTELTSDKKESLLVAQADTGPKEYAAAPWTKGDTTDVY
jgi:hypothetical protein